MILMIIHKSDAKLKWLEPIYVLHVIDVDMTNEVPINT
jgi:hypothetical protein